MAKVKFGLGINTMSGAVRRERMIFSSFRNNTVTTMRVFTYPRLTPNNHFRGLIFIALGRLWHLMHTNAIEAFNEYAISFNAEHLRDRQLTVRGYNMFIMGFGSGWTIDLGYIPEQWGGPLGLKSVRGANIGDLISAGYLPRVSRWHPSFATDFSTGLGLDIELTDVNQALAEALEYQTMFKSGSLQHMYNDQKISAISKEIMNVLEPDVAKDITLLEVKDIARGIVETEEYPRLTGKRRKLPQDKQDNIMFRETLKRVIKAHADRVIINESLSGSNDVKSKRIVKEALKTKKSTNQTLSTVEG